MEEITLLEKLNSFTRRTHTLDEVYIFSVILCDNEVDRDFEKFSLNALKSLKELFIGKTGIFDHNTKENTQIARIFETELITDESRLTADTMAGADFNYNELVAFWGKFEDYDMTTIIASPTSMAKILSFEQMKYACADFMSTGAVKTPFGSNLVKSTSVADTKLIGLDKKCALEMINATDIILENDRLIDRQIDRTAVSVTTGFAKIIPEATRVLTIG